MADSSSPIHKDEISTASVTSIAEGQTEQEVNNMVDSTDDLDDSYAHTETIDNNEYAGSRSAAAEENDGVTVSVSSTMSPMSTETERELTVTLPKASVVEVIRGQAVSFKRGEGQAVSKVENGQKEPEMKMASRPSKPVDLTTKVKLILQGAYRRVTPESSRTSNSIVQSISSTSTNIHMSPVAGGQGQPTITDQNQPAITDQVVYTVQTITNNNLNDNCVIDSSTPSNVDCNHCPTRRTGSIESYEEVCRICHDNTNGESFITPCLCKGSMGLVHQRCLERWLGESAKTCCEICGYEYVTDRRPKYQGCSSVLSWIRHPINPQDTKNLFFDIACFFVLTPLACVSAWLCVIGSQHYAVAAQDRYKETLNSNRWTRYRQIQDASNTTWTSVGLLTLTGTLLTAYYIWLFVAFRYHYQVWRDWQGRNYQVTVLPVSPEIARAHQALSEENSSPTRNNIGGNRTDDVPIVINMEPTDGDPGSSSSSSCSHEDRGGPSGQGQMSNALVNTYNNNLQEHPPEACSTQSI